MSSVTARSDALVPVVVVIVMSGKLEYAPPPSDM